MRALRPLLAATLLILAVTPARADYGTPRHWFTIQSGAIVESSGVAASAAGDAIVYTHNDSGDSPRFFALRTSDGQTAATFGLGLTVRQVVDMEDMARGPGRDGRPALFLGDIGDNAAARPALIVYEVPEPAVDATATGVFAAADPSATYVLVYEDGPHDAETLMVDPRTGALAIVTKIASGVSGVYVGEPVGAPVQVMRRVASIDFNALGADDTAATAGDIAPDGSRVVVRTYEDVFEWTIPAAGLAAAFSQPPLQVWVPPTEGSEGIAYTSAGTGLFTSTEGVRRPVYLIPPA